MVKQSISVQMIGVIIGALLFGQLSDMFGRKWVNIFSKINFFKQKFRPFSQHCSSPKFLWSYPRLPRIYFGSLPVDSSSIFLMVEVSRKKKSMKIYPRMVKTEILSHDFALSKNRGISLASTLSYPINFPFFSGSIWSM